MVQTVATFRLHYSRRPNTHLAKNCKPILLAIVQAPGLRCPDTPTLTGACLVNLKDLTTPRMLLAMAAGALAALILCVAFSCSAMAQTSCYSSGNYTSCSDGSSAYRSGNSTYYGDGSSSYRSGNSIYNSDGSSAYRSGNSMYFSDGTSAYRSGNSTYFSNGTSCQRVGSSVYCQ